MREQEMRTGNWISSQKRMFDGLRVYLRPLIGVMSVCLSCTKTMSAIIAYEGFDLKDRSHGQDINSSTGGVSSVGFTGSWSANTLAGEATYQSNGLAWTYRDTSVSNASGALLSSTNTVSSTDTQMISRRLPAPGATTVWGSYLFRATRLSYASKPLGVTLDPEIRNVGQLSAEAKGYNSAATFRIDRGNNQSAESGSQWALVNTTYLALFKAQNVNQTNATVSVKMWVMTQAQYNGLIWPAPTEDIEQVLDSAALGTGSAQLTSRIRASVTLTGGAVASWAAGDWLTLVNTSSGNDVTFDEVRLTTTLHEAAGVKARDRPVSRLIAYEGFDLDDRTNGQDINGSVGGVSSVGLTAGWSANTLAGEATYQSNGLAWTYRDTSVSNAPGALRSTNTVGGTGTHLISRRLPAPGATTVWGSYLFKGSQLQGASAPVGLTIDPAILSVGQFTAEVKGYNSAATFRIDKGNTQSAESGSQFPLVNTTYLALFKAQNVNQTNATVSVKMWVMTQAQYDSLIINGDSDRVEVRLDSAALGRGNTQLTSRIRASVALTGGAVASWAAGDWLTLVNTSTGINDVTLDEVRLGKTLNDVAGTLSYPKGTLIRMF